MNAVYLQKKKSFTLLGLRSPAIQLNRNTLKQKAV